MSDRFRFRTWDNRFKKYRNGLAVYNNTICTYDDNDCILEQCTGLKDKNGKLIYEGDILQDSEQKILVKYDVNRHCFMFEYQDTSAYKRICDMDVLSGNFEVIGNVHENPDLLENKDE